jgi:hypothetical protein
MTPLIVGQKNPYSGEPLAPHPPGCAGHRLWRMLDDVRSTTAEEYLLAFRRINLRDAGKQRTVDAVVASRDVILLGDEVWLALGPHRA